MIYPFSLSFVGLVVGILLIATHVFAVVAPATVKPLLRTFPRSRVMGTTFLAAGAIWAFWLVQTMDLGEFSHLRKFLVIAVPVGAVLTWQFVDEFLAVRALGIIALLAADILLEAAFLRPEISRLLLVTLAYVWILGGLFLIGMPYILRDFLAAALNRPTLYKIAAIGGLVYGFAITICALTLW